VRGDHHREELARLCQSAGVTIDAVVRETLSSPDLFAQLSSDPPGASAYEATSAAASALRKQTGFIELLVAKMSLGSEAVKDVGNLYCAALPAWIAAGLEDAVERGEELLGSPLVAVGYGSGDAAEAWPLHAAPGWRDAAKRIGFAEALAGAVDLSQGQYEALHDRRDAADIEYRPREEFAIRSVGQKYDAGFQDLGVEYYEFVS